MSEQPGLTVAVILEQVRPLLSGLAMQQAGNLAPDLRSLCEIPGLSEAVQLRLAATGASGKAGITLVGTDEAAGERIEEILRDSLVAARDLAVAEVERTFIENNPDVSEAMQEATAHYANRISNSILRNLVPKRNQDHVTIEVESAYGVATSGALVGLLLPAVQAARTAARRMSGSNNLRQVLLGMHNYHSAFGKLPDSAITDDNGEPLLSWRVALLPYIEEQALYNEFHLNEPWDSEHNLPLSKQLPAVYSTPNAVLPEGFTIIQAAVGEKIGLKPLEKTRFHDFLDGLSNTILIMEVNPDAAVPWSKPADLEIDLNDPLANLGQAQPGGFHVGLADGAVKFVTPSISPDLFHDLLTRDGKEIIAQDF